MIDMRDDFLDPDLIAAAVLIPLLLPAKRKDGAAAHVTLSGSTGPILLPTSTDVLLTVRTDKVEHHKGQISFPGGVHEAHDASLEATALRESAEEIGLDPGAVRIVAELPEVPTVATRFRVRPYVGIVDSRPELRSNPDEIGEIILVPLHHLLDPANSILETYERRGLRYQMRTYHYGSHRIWGATGLILQILLEKYLSRP